MKLTKEQKAIINNAEANSISKICMDMICSRLEALDKVFMKDINKAFKDKVEEEIAKEIETEHQATKDKKTETLN